MFHAMRNTLRSWMFIYAGLVAAIVLASQPLGVGEASSIDSAVRPLIGETPLGRSDI